MNERQRILDLVKKGVITSEEALVLLENLAKTSTDQNDTQPENAGTDQGDTNDSEADRTADLKLRQTELRERLSSLDHQVQAAQEQVTVLDTMEDLEGLSDEKAKERTDLKQKVNDLTQARVEVAKQKQVVDDQLNDLADTSSRPDMFGKFAEDWKDTAGSTISDLSKKITQASNQVGSFVKDSVNTIMDNVDWKDINVKVPGLATAEFEHQFLYENNAAKLIDLKLANGSINIQPSENENVAVTAKVKLFGKMNESTPFEAFLDRANIDVTNDRFVFQVPNKRVKVDLTVYLPKRTYEHVNVKMLNGNLSVDGFNASDFYAKTANGYLKFNNTQLSYLEAEDVNGDVQLQGGQVTDSILTTVNGNVIVAGNIHTGQFTTINGEVRGTVSNTDLHKFVANSVNGNVKVAVPAEMPLKLEAKTRFGQVKNRLSDTNAESQAESKTGAKKATFERGSQEDPAELELSTTAGNILLKDSNEQ